MKKKSSTTKSKNKQSLDLTDEEYLILDKVAKDINNIQLLDKIPKKKLEELLKFTTDHCNSFVFKKYVVRDSHISIDLENVDIESYTKLYNPKYNIMMYVIGERHRSKYLCENRISKFYGGMQNSPYLIDVFTEIRRYPIPYTSNSVNIAYLQNYYRAYGRAKNIRAHESDIRTLDDTFRKFDGVDLSPLVISDISKELVYRIEKQIGKMYDDNYKRILKEKLKETVSQINEIRNRYVRNNYVDIDNNYDDLNSYTLMTKTVSIMEIYTCARMHRIFERKNNINNNCSSIPKNIVYFAGGQHCDILIDLLTKNLDYKILVQNSTKENCLVVKDKDYMFHRPI